MKSTKRGIYIGVCVFGLLILVTCILIQGSYLVEMSGAQWYLHNDGTFRNSYTVDGKKIITTSKSKKGIDLNTDNVEQMMRDCRTIKVAVIDTGINITHEDIRKSVWINQNEVIGDGFDNDGNGYIDDIYGWNFVDNSNILFDESRDFNYHGTAIAGILCSGSNLIKNIGAYSNTEIICIRALDDEGRGDTNSIIEAILYAENAGATICCMSFKCDGSNELERTIEESEMLFVVPSGNQAMDIDTLSSGLSSYKSQNIITVANINSEGRLNELSNYGYQNVDIAAPGTDIYTCAPINDYLYATGTSFSVPVVAGVIAAIYCNSEDLTIEECKEVLLVNTTQIDGIKQKVKTGGIPNLYESLKSVADY